MIDILTWENGGVTYYQKMEITLTDVVSLPAGAPPDASRICAIDWRRLVGEPGEGETFEQREADYIAALGLVVSE